MISCRCPVKAISLALKTRCTFTRKLPLSIIIGWSRCPGSILVSQFGRGCHECTLTFFEKVFRIIVTNTWMKINISHSSLRSRHGHRRTSMFILCSYNIIMTRTEVAFTLFQAMVFPRRSFNAILNSIRSYREIIRSICIWTR